MTDLAGALPTAVSPRAKIRGTVIAVRKRRMATLPYYAFSPSTLLSLLGFVRRGDPTEPTPVDDWRTAHVDVVIPALNEASHIALCLASLLRQTVRPHRIVLIDDGSSDKTIEIAQAFCAMHQMALTTVHRRAPIGKTPSIGKQAHEPCADVEFVLDGDTVLESPNYIERVVQELYQAVGVASACGLVLPQRHSDRRRWIAQREVQQFTNRYPQYRPPQESGLRAAARGLTNAYRDVLYAFLQRFIYRGQNKLLGTITNPVGCAVAYRRRYIEELFDHFGPIYGNSLTNSEDIFIGMALLDMGYRNVQVFDVHVRTVEPPVQRLPRQLYLWSSAFLQSCYRFDPLLRSPFAALRNRLRRTDWLPAPADALVPSSGSGAATLPGLGRPGPLFRVGVTKSGILTEPTFPRSVERRLVAEPHRQPFGRRWTARQGRPAGWMVLMEAIEKVFFPTTLLILILLRAWHGLLLTVAIETAIGLCILAAVMTGRRAEYVLKALVMVPLRYLAVVVDLVTIPRFAWDLWVTRRRNWRK